MEVRGQLAGAGFLCLACSMRLTSDHRLGAELLSVARSYWPNLGNVLNTFCLLHGSMRPSFSSLPFSLPQIPETLREGERGGDAMG